MIKFLACVLLLSIFVSCTSSIEPSQTSVDSLRYETITMMQSVDGCDKDSAGCTYIEFTYPQFTGISGPLADTLNIMMRNAFGNKEKNIFSPDSVQQDFLAAYASYKLKKKDALSSWFVEKNMKVLTQNPKWFTLGYWESTFTGGAHPNNYETYTILDKTTGRKLLLNDFFDSSAVNKLTILGEVAFRSIKRIPQKQTLAEAGFWFDGNRFTLNNNFYFNDRGITFLYNTYEIGPYVAGPTSITIPASKVAPLLKK